MVLRRKKLLTTIGFIFFLLLLIVVFYLFVIPKSEKDPEPIKCTLGQPEYENTIRVIIDKPKGNLTIDDIAWFQNYVKAFYGSARVDNKKSTEEKVYFLRDLNEDEALIKEEWLPFAIYIYLRENPNNAKLNVEDAKALLNNTADEGTRKALKDYAYWFNGDGDKSIENEAKKLNKAIIISKIYDKEATNLSYSELDMLYEELKNHPEWLK